MLLCWVLMAHTFNLSPGEAEAGRQISKFEASMLYRVSSRTARATQRKRNLGKNNTKPDKKSI